MRLENRANNQTRQVKFTKNYTKHALGSVLVEFGDTKVITTASVVRITTNSDLYVLWANNKYQITTDLNEGMFSSTTLGNTFDVYFDGPYPMANISSASGIYDKLITDPIKQDYEFHYFVDIENENRATWSQIITSTESNNYKQLYGIKEDTTYNKLSNSTICAWWTPTIFNIHLDANGGLFASNNLATKSITITYSYKNDLNSLSYDLTHPKLHGYEMTGWTVNGGPRIATNGQLFGTDWFLHSRDNYLRANWTEIYYNVVFTDGEANGAATGVVPPAINNVRYDDIITLPTSDLVYNSRVFLYWQVGNGAREGTRFETLPATTSRLSEVYGETIYINAVYGGNIIVHFARNGHGSPSSETNEYDITVTPGSEVTLRRSYQNTNSYHYTHYNTQSDGRGVMYAINATVSYATLLTLLDSGRVVFYPYWIYDGPSGGNNNTGRGGNRGGGGGGGGAGTLAPISNIVEVIWITNQDGTYSAKDLKGTMLTGWHRINDEGTVGYYYFDANYIMQAGWFPDNGEIYFLGKGAHKGAMVTGDNYIDGTLYHFADDGKLMKDDGSLTFKVVEHGNWEYDQNTDTWRYFDEDPQTGNRNYMIDCWFRTAEGNVFRADPSGIMLTGWYQEGGNIYYFKEQGNDRGAMAIGPMNINGLWYMFDEDGRRLTGLVEYEPDHSYENETQPYS